MSFSMETVGTTEAHATAESVPVLADLGPSMLLEPEKDEKNKSRISSQKIRFT